MRSSPSLILSLLLLGSAATASVRPQIPPACVDSELMKGQTPQEFFGARAKQTTCRQEVAVLKAQFVAERARLATLTGANALDDQAEKMDKARKAWLRKLDECGNCATRGEIRKHSTGGRTEYWYIADGSCLIEGQDEADVVRSFEVKADSLLTAKGYPHNQPGGIPAIMEYAYVDPSGALLEDVEKVAVGTPFLSYLVVGGPDVPVVGRIGYRYLFGNETRFDTVDGVREFHHTFEGKSFPRGFRHPSVEETLASGRKRAVRAMDLTRVQGKWCLNSEGYLRYYTAADLGMDLTYAYDLAIDILLVTLETMYERGLGALP